MRVGDMDYSAVVVIDPSQIMRVDFTPWRVASRSISRQPALSPGKDLRHLLCVLLGSILADDLSPTYFKKWSACVIWKCFGGDPCLKPLT